MVKKYKGSDGAPQTIATEGARFAAAVKERLQAMSAGTLKACTTFYRTNSTTLYLECIDRATSKVLGRSFAVRHTAGGALAPAIDGQVLTALTTFQKWVQSQSKGIKALRLVFAFPRNGIVAAGSSTLARGSSMGVNTSDAGATTFRVIAYDDPESSDNPQKEVFDGCSCCVGGFRALKVGPATSGSKSVVVPKQDRTIPFTALEVANDSGYGSVVPDTFYAQNQAKKGTVYVKRIDKSAAWGQSPTLYLCTDPAPTTKA